MKILILGGEEKQRTAEDICKRDGFIGPVFEGGESFMAEIVHEHISLTSGKIY